MRNPPVTLLVSELTSSRLESLPNLLSLARPKSPEEGKRGPVFWWGGGVGERDWAQPLSLHSLR